MRLPWAAGDLWGADACARLINEATILSLLGTARSAAPTVTNVEVSEGTTLMVMEWLSGSMLSNLSQHEQIEGVALLADALSRIHEAGVVHRDVKLSNAMLTNEGVRLIDFELASRIGVEPFSHGGTNGYIPPEGMDGIAHPAVDIYALGACLFNAVVGFDPSFLPNDGGRLVGILRLLRARRAALLVATLTNRRLERRPSARKAADIIEDSLEILGREIERRPDAFEGRTMVRIDSRWIRRAVIEAGLATRGYRRKAIHGHYWQNFHLQPDFPCVGINLGAAGIILGLISIERALGVTTFESDILAGAEWLVDSVPGANTAGLFMGNAGIALALSVAGRRLRLEDLVQQSRSFLSAAIEAIDDDDLFGGRAGVVYAGCMISEILDEKWPLEMVGSMALRMLDSAECIEGVLCWNTAAESKDSPYLGAAHGTAGIALALGTWGRMAASEEAEMCARAAFASLFDAGRSVDGETLRVRADFESDVASVDAWCHGPAGYLWCMLQTFGDDPSLRNEIDWAVSAFATSLPVGNPTYCHGLSGQMELWRMLSDIPRFSRRAESRTSELYHALRLMHRRLQGFSVWGSEESQIVTPDLWVGFLGPATALALSQFGCPDPLLSGAWLKSAARGGVQP